MKSVRAWIPLFLLFCLSGVLGIALLGGGDPSAVASPMTGKPAPSLVAPTQEDDGPLTIDSLKGKPHLVNFFASWCGPCAAENALLVSLAAKHRVLIVGVDMKDNSEALKDYLQRRGNPYDRIAPDQTGRVAIDWGVAGIPETFAVDADGKIVDHHIAGLTDEDAERLLKSLKITLSDADREDLRRTEEASEKAAEHAPD